MSWAPIAGIDRCASCLPSFSRNCSATCDDSPPWTGSADHQPERSSKRTVVCAAAGTVNARRHTRVRKVGDFMKANVADGSPRVNEQCGHRRCRRGKALQSELKSDSLNRHPDFRNTDGLRMLQHEHHEESRKTAPSDSEARLRSRPAKGSVLVGRSLPARGTGVTAQRESRTLFQLATQLVRRFAIALIYGRISMLSLMSGSPSSSTTYHHVPGAS